MIKSSEDKWSILNQEIKIFIKNTKAHIQHTHMDMIFSNYTHLWVCGNEKMVNRLRHSICKIIKSQDHRYRKEERSRGRLIVLVGKSVWSMFSARDIALCWTELLKLGDSPITANQSDTITHKEPNRTMALFIHTEHFQNLRHQGRKTFICLRRSPLHRFPKIT